MARRGRVLGRGGAREPLVSGREVWKPPQRRMASAFPGRGGLERSATSGLRSGSLHKCLFFSFVPSEILWPVIKVL